MAGTTNLIRGMSRSFSRLLILTAVAGMLAAAPVFAQTSAPASGSQPAVVLELFTSQGCSSCPDANRLLARMADTPDTLALTYAVDYWDYLGWKDTLAKPEFTDRQRAYATRFNKGELYTPAVIIMGRADVPGTRITDIETAMAAVRKGMKRRPGPLLRLDKDAHRVWVGSGRRDLADVWLVRFDPTQRTQKVTAGENAGHTVVHRNTVVDVQHLGTWTGKPVRFALPDDAPARATGTAILVQHRNGGDVLSAVADIPQ